MPPPPAEAGPPPDNIKDDQSGMMPERANEDTTSEGLSGQAVRFSSVNQEIEPAEVVGSVNSASVELQLSQDISPQAEEELRRLSKGLQDSRLQKHRTCNFSFEPVSLPPSRVASSEAGPALRSREPSYTSNVSHGASSTTPTSAVQSPPLTPAGSQSRDSAITSKLAALAIGQDPSAVTPQISPAHGLQAPDSSGKVLAGDESSQAKSSASSRPSSASGLGSTRPTTASTGPSVSGSHAKHPPDFVIGPSAADSSSRSRETSPSRTSGSTPGSGTSTPYNRSFAPGGDKNDPYARSKRPPQPRNVDEIDSRFVFGAKDAKRGLSGAASSQSRSRSHPRDGGGGGKGLEDKRPSVMWRKEQEDASLHGKPHGSMSDLKRFFRIGHKSKRCHSPAASTRSSKSGTQTPPHQLPPAVVPFAEDHGLESKYGRFGKVLGSGAGGSVRLMKRSNDSVTFAVKEFRAKHSYETDKEYAKKVTAEFCIGSTLHHGNIIETLDIVHEKGKWYEIMEYAPYDLFAIVMTGKMSREEVTCTFLQIVAGVTYLHSMGLAHRDLKLDNVVVSDRGIMKLIDFGSAAVFQYPFESGIVCAQGIVGSDPYLAPEVFESGKYDPQRVDIWSLAIIYCCMALRRFPWKVPRLTDNSYKLFVTPATPGQVTGDSAATRHPKSTADLPSKTKDASSDDVEASRKASGESHQHHHHHHHHRVQAESAPTDRRENAEEERAAEAAAPSTTPSSTTAAAAAAPTTTQIKGPWRLLRLLPRESRAVISQMLEVDPKKRATLADLLADSWVTGSAVCSQSEGGEVVNAPGHTHTLEPGTGVATPSSGGAAGAQKAS
ncbi:MAG: hypothetical protein M1825_003207 [Sarcosagium campestre]|nr:MAG: hypothetical protein M1825_003207 [Sarcosagium campestre]